MFSSSNASSASARVTQITQSVSLIKNDHSDIPCVFKSSCEAPIMTLLREKCCSVFERLELHGSSSEGDDSCCKMQICCCRLSHYEYRTTSIYSITMFPYAHSELTVGLVKLLISFELMLVGHVICICPARLTGL